MSETEKTEACIRTGNRLLRGELSAVQTYEMAIRRHPGVAAAFQLDHIANEHRRSVRLLKVVVREMGGKPVTDSGLRGLFANSVQMAVRFPGARSMVESLRQCEEQRRNDYEEALDAAGVRESFKTLIRIDLLTSVEDHLTGLERLPAAKVGFMPIVGHRPML